MHQRKNAIFALNLHEDCIAYCVKTMTMHSKSGTFFVGLALFEGISIENVESYSEDVQKLYDHQ